MSHVFSRARTLFVVFAGLAIGACASSTSPSATLSAEAVPSELAALSQGVTDETLANAGWTCVAPPPPLPLYNLRTSRLGLSSISGPA